MLNAYYYQLDSNPIPHAAIHEEKGHEKIHLPIAHQIYEFEPSAEIYETYVHFTQAFVSGYIQGVTGHDWEGSFRNCIPNDIVGVHAKIGAAISVPLAEHSDVPYFLKETINGLHTAFDEIIPLCHEAHHDIWHAKLALSRFDYLTKNKPLDFRGKVAERCSHEEGNCFHVAQVIPDLYKEGHVREAGLQTGHLILDLLHIIQ